MVHSPSDQTAIPISDRGRESLRIENYTKDNVLAVESKCNCKVAVGKGFTACAVMLRYVRIILQGNMVWS